MIAEGGRGINTLSKPKFILINIITLINISFFLFFETYIFKWSDNQYYGATNPVVTYFALYSLVIYACNAPMHRPSTKTYTTDMLIAVHLVNIISG